MAVVDVLNSSGKKVSQVDLNDEIYNVPVKKSVLHDVVTMQLANRRAGSASTKHRSDVTGSTRKLFRQKGTGRARRGNIKSPLLRGGGVAFGPKPKSWGYKVPKKVRKLALKMALSSKFKDDDILILDQFELDQIKTQVFMKMAGNLNMENALIVIDQENEKLELSSRNLTEFKVMRFEGLNVYDILKHRTLVLLEASVKAIEGRLL
ncbi:MAG: 50S ribosomal protein L4 [Deltaproteobacteria bacterium]|jgi:large subunit ribosomal protein L4|nr:50S ribosomal protein L4 [Deltaproteobacteria bacterium]